MKQKDILKQRKNRKDELKKKNRRKRFDVSIRYTSNRTFTVMADNEKEAVIKAINKLLLIEPINTNIISALARTKRGTKVYDTHLNLNELNDLIEELDN